MSEDCVASQARRLMVESMFIIDSWTARDVFDGGGTAAVAATVDGGGEASDCGADVDPWGHSLAGGATTPFRFPLEVRPLSSAGITRRPQSYGPIRHPAGPDCPSRGPGWRVRTTDRASRVATSSLFHACQRHYPGRSASVHLSLFFPNRRRPSPNLRRVGSRVARFEACSASTHVPACMFAELLFAALCHQSTSAHVVTSMNRSGCYQPKTTIIGWVSHPLGKRAFTRRTEFFGLVRDARDARKRRRMRASGGKGEGPDGTGPAAVPARIGRTA